MGDDGMGRGDVGSDLNLSGVERRDEAEGQERLRLLTDAGAVECRWHPAPAGDAAVLWVFGAGGGLGGPAGGLYTRLGQQLRPRGVASLELAYRHPGRLEDCVRDVLLGLAWLAGEGRRRVALVGHSFGGAVVITAGAAAGEAVVAVAALSSQTRGTEAAASLSPRPLLVMHGTADEVLPDACSRDIYERARQPKELILYPGCRHGLDQCREELDRDLTGWLERVVAGGPGRNPRG
jgi:alpha/beta superfamily hydrolase